MPPEGIEPTRISLDNRFTVCLASLTNYGGMLELPAGFGPAICCLQGSCLTVWPEKQFGILFCSREYSENSRSGRLGLWHPHEDSNSDKRFRRPLHCPVVLCEYIGSPGGNRTRKTGVLSAVHMPVLLRDYVGLLRGIRTHIFRILSSARMPIP